MSVKVKVMVIPGAPLEGTSPLPIFHKKDAVEMKTVPEFPEEMKVDLGNRSPVLPYKMQDRYSRKRLPLKKKTIVMENAYLVAKFWPEDGGKLYSLFDKEHNRELLMSNPVYQPGNLALRNAWHSGGIEWNFGSYGHHARTCDNLYAAVLQDPEGDEFVRMYEFDRTKSTLYQIDFHLPEDSKVLYSHVKLFNPFDEDSTTYWWTNIAIPEDGNTRVLSSVKGAIVLGDPNGLTYEQVPDISMFPGKDLSYPHNASRGFDYFFQAPEGVRTTWEAGAYSDGLVFYDRSTAPLLYHKMFCWGNHSAGKHWQDFLSEPGKGYYIEIQGGIARSQCHDKLFPARSTIEWTQCFGGMMLDKEQLHQPDYDKANEYLDAHLETVMDEEELFRKNEQYAQAANISIDETNLIHYGNGWGALEVLRIQQKGDRTFPQSVCFPKSSIGAEQYPWYALLVDGVLPEEDPSMIPASWMVDEKWMAILEQSIANGGESWLSMLHYGVMLNEMMDRRHVAREASLWGQYGVYREKARKALERSVELCPSVWALRCLFCIADEEKNDALAEQYYDQVFQMEASTVDFAFAAEYMLWLNSKGKYEKAWDLYNRMPENIQKAERMLLTVAQTAIKLRKLDVIEKVFEHGEYADIREGESSLTDIWFEYCALKMAAERGIADPQGDVLEKLMDEAWDTCPPPAEIDFRMSFDRQRKYRMEN